MGGAGRSEFDHVAFRLLALLRYSKCRCRRTPMPTQQTPTDQVALITGAAQRVGAEIARELHRSGMRVIIHYRASADAAQTLQEELLAARPDSAALLRADLLDTAALPALVAAAEQQWGRLDALINNASSFYPTAIGTITETQWDDLMGSNLKASLFLSQAAAPLLAAQQGNIVNIVDIHAERPLKGYPLYCAAKAGLAMLTKALARELAPTIRVNAVAPGAILWPEHASEETRRAIISRTALKRQGDPRDIARTVRFLVTEADYITGQIITVDGGRSLSS